MTLPPPPPPPPAASPDDADPRAEPTPLTPANVGHTIGDDADPEQDVAPNLGGEGQMQDS
jgi:hypothetical protein